MNRTVELALAIDGGIEEFLPNRSQEHTAPGNITRTVRITRAIGTADRSQIRAFD